MAQTVEDLQKIVEKLTLENEALKSQKSLLQEQVINASNVIRNNMTKNNIDALEKIRKGKLQHTENEIKFKEGISSILLNNNDNENEEAIEEGDELSEGKIINPLEQVADYEFATEATIGSGTEASNAFKAEDFTINLTPNISPGFVSSFLKKSFSLKHKMNIRLTGTFTRTEIKNVLNFVFNQPAIGFAAAVIDDTFISEVSSLVVGALTAMDVMTRKKYTNWTIDDWVETIVQYMSATKFQMMNPSVKIDRKAFNSYASAMGDLFAYFFVSPIQGDGVAFLDTNDNIYIGVCMTQKSLTALNKFYFYSFGVGFVEVIGNPLNTRVKSNSRPYTVLKPNKRNRRKRNNNNNSVTNSNKLNRRVNKAIQQAVKQYVGNKG